MTEPADLPSPDPEQVHQAVVDHTTQQPNPAAEQAATMAQVTERGPLLPAEEEMDKFMTLLKEQSEQIKTLQGQLGTMQEQQQAALSAAGGPMPTRYASAVAEKAAAAVAAHPDAPDGHFAPLTKAAADLKTAAAAVVKGSGVAADAEKAAAAVEKFITRTHWKAWGKHIDWSAMADDVEAVVEAVRAA